MSPRYAPLYCEENVWFLLAEGDLTHGHAVFVSNASGSVAIWSQKASPRSDGLVLWDYHVVALALAEVGGEWHVFDLDSTAGSPVPLRAWANASFPFAGALPEDLEPMFRVVTAEALSAHFRTDRSHMIGPDGTWLAEPPPWPPLHDDSNLSAYVDPDSAPGAARGEVVDLCGLLGRFGDQR